jgi:hypothetical protein
VLTQGLWQQPVAELVHLSRPPFHAAALTILTTLRVSCADHAPCSDLDRAWRPAPKSGPGGTNSSGTSGQHDSTPPFQASGQQQLRDLPGSIASLNSNILCNLVTDLRFGCLLGTGSFGEYQPAAALLHKGDLELQLGLQLDGSRGETALAAVPRLVMCVLPDHVCLISHAFALMTDTAPACARAS